MQLPQFNPSILAGRNAGILEPGLLQVLRVTVVLQVSVQFFALSTSLVSQAFTPPLDLVWLPMIPLLLLAFWPQLSERLGKWFLPVVIVYYTVVSVAGHALVMNWFLQQPALRDYFVRSSKVPPINDFSSGLFIMFLVPLVLLAWQYDFRRVVLFSLGAALLESIAIGGVLSVNGLSLFPSAAVGLAHAIFFTFIGYVITRMMNAQRAQRRELAAYAATLEQLTLSRERNRMARELHDTLAHSLSTVSVQLEAVDSALDREPATARVLLGKALAQTRSGLTETRRAMQSLRASPLEDLGLALAVRSLAESTARRGGMTATVEITEPLPALPPGAEQGIYRVAQEALANVALHAGATRLEVTLVATDGIVLTVRDDGRGFDPALAAANGHFGLQGMRERAAMMGAVLEVQSVAGGGTTVRLEAP